MSILTAHQRGRAPHRPRGHTGQCAMNLAAVARLLGRTLTERGVDWAGVGELGRALNLSEPVVREASAHAPYLGLCPSGGGLLLYCLPPEPIEAGFRVEHRGGRLVLRLPAQGPRPPLSLCGRWVGTVPAGERAATIGAGQLAHLVSRLTLMAGHWLPPGEASPARLLFELIANGWRLGSSLPWSTGELRVHRADFGKVVAGGADAATSVLELVTHHRGGQHELVNLYPVCGQA